MSAGQAGASGEIRARQPKAIHSALTVLEEVARCGAGVTAREISDNLVMPRATTYRLLNLLVQDEYLVRMPDLRGFALGRKVVQLSHLVAPAPPPTAVREVIDELRDHLRGGVHLVRYEGESLHVVDPDPDFPPSDESLIRRKLDLSAMGRLLLAERTATIAGLEEVVAEVRDLGYARQVNALAAGYGCIAVPIRDRSGVLVAGLCVSTTARRIQNPSPLLDLLWRGARELTPLLA